MTHPQQNRPALRPDSPLQATVHTSTVQELSVGGLFSPTTSTLLTGPHSSVLVDAQYLPEDVDALQELITASGTQLTHIVITHAHGDHFFGIERLLAMNPGARAVALPSIAQDARVGLEAQSEKWASWFSGRAVTCAVTPQALALDDALPGSVPQTAQAEVAESATIDLDGHPIHVLRVPQADISPTSIVWAPDAGLVVTGDVVYNGVHPMLAYAGPQERTDWLRSISVVEALEATAVVAGHKRPGVEDAPAALERTRAYIESFARNLGLAEGTKEMVAAQQEEFPDWENPTALVGSASAARKRQKAGGEG